MVPYVRPARATRRRAVGALRWLRPGRRRCTAVGVIARAYLALSAGLLAWSVLPALVGWDSFTVISGSMEPSIRPGDVLVTAPVDDGTRIQQGWVVTYVNPDQPDPRRPNHVVSHRVLEARADGSITTRGDSNPTPDRRTITRSDVVGMGRLLVPRASLPLYWWRTRELVPLATWLVASVAALVIVAAEPPRCARDDDADDADDTDDTDDTDDGGHDLACGSPPPRGRAAALASRIRAAALPAGAAVLVLGPPATGAVLTAGTDNRSNGWTSSANFGTSAYQRAVLADSPLWYYPLDSQLGPIDISGNGRHGTTSPAGVRFGVTPGAVPTTGTSAVGLDGSTGCVYSGGAAVSAPSDYSVEAWIRTTSTAGGKVIGFEDTQASASSTQADRHVYLTTGGLLRFGAGSGRTVSSARAYNDGAWHHVVATMRATGQPANRGMRLYVDGAVVASSTSTSSRPKGGWWRVGCGTLTGWGGAPSQAGTAFLAGDVDQVATYLTALPAARVAAHWAAR